jgi:hypothetical protein
VVKEKMLEMGIPEHEYDNRPDTFMQGYVNGFSQGIRLFEFLLSPMQKIEEGE